MIGRRKANSSVIHLLCTFNSWTVKRCLAVAWQQLFHMATQTISIPLRPRIYAQLQALRGMPFPVSQSHCICRCHRSRLFSSSTRLYRQQTDYKESFGTRLRRALGATKIKWYPIPVGVGIGFLGLGQLYRVNEREKARREEEWEDDGYLNSTGSDGEGKDGEREGRPKRRQRIKPTGPWFGSWHT